MGENSKIEWTTHTFNPWIGCTKVAAGCTHCYAETFAKRTGKAKWGPQGTRVKTSESYWKQPLKWNLEAMGAGERRRVFCASMADVFEDWFGLMTHHSGHDLLVCDGCGRFHADDEAVEASSCACSRWLPRIDSATIGDVRRELFKLIDATPHLDWLLLTKRPENIPRMWPQIGFADAGVPGTLGRRPFLGNCWLGCSISTQADADRNIPLLLECRDLAPVLFVSAEPLLEAVNLGQALEEHGYESGGPQGWVQTAEHGINWVIVGGESGHGARPMHPDWARSIRDQCQAAGVAFHFKQHGEWSSDTADYERPKLGPEKVIYALPDGSLAKIGNGLLKPGTELIYRVGKKAAGRLLDGIEYSQFPEVNHG